MYPPFTETEQKTELQVTDPIDQNTVTNFQQYDNFTGFPSASIPNPVISPNGFKPVIPKSEPLLRAGFKNKGISR